jgi:hypothetical protein
MDNAQTTNLLNIVWLAGFMDGEGSFGVNSRMKNGKRLNMIPAIQVASTEPRVIERIKNILEENSITYYINSYMSLEFRNAKPAYSLRLGRLGQVKMFIELILPYLCVKDAQARLVLDYVNLRISKGARKGNFIGQEYGEEEVSIFDELRKLNKKGVSEAIRETPDRIIISGEDMVQPIEKSIGPTV